MMFKLFTILYIFLQCDVSLAQRVIHADTIQSNSNTGSICVPPTTTIDCSEMSYIDGATSNIQTQLNAKEPTISTSANTFIYANSSNLHLSLPNWTIYPIYYGVESNLTLTAPPDAGDISHRGFYNYTEVAVPLDTAQFHPENARFDMSIDALHADFDLNSAYGVVMSKSIRGDGAITNTGLLDLSDGMGNGGNAGTIASSNTVNINAQNATGYTTTNYNLLNSAFTNDGDMDNVNYFNGFLQNNGTINNNLNLLNFYLGGTGTNNGVFGLNLGIQTNTAGGMTLANMYSNGSVANGFNGIYINSDNTIATNGNFLGMTFSNTAANLNFINTGIPNTATITGDFRQLQMGNDAPVGNNSAGALFFNSGDIAKSWTGVGAYASGNIGDGTGNNAVAFDANLQGTTMDGNLTGFNLFTDMAVTTGNNIQGVNITNQGTGYRFGGVNVGNNQDMGEEAVGFRFNQDGDARTMSGVDVVMQGNATDDASGLRVNVSNLTSSSSSQHVTSAQFSGGNFSVQSDFKPFSGVGVDIGNNVTSTTQVASGFPITGTDLIQTLIQNNLILDDTVGAGAFGLGINAIGMVSQIGFNGVTQPIYRSLLLGTTVPQGSGGTLTDHVVLELLGLASFGGSITNTNRWGIVDSQLVGQNFCDGATNCWFLNVRDVNAENHLPKLAIGTSTQKVSSGVKLEVNDGHIKSDQTTAPVPTVDANAGTGATCTVSGATDTAGTIEIVEGSAGWAGGSQCSIAFNVGYGSAPKCTLTAINNNAAVAATNVYISKTTTDLVINFVNADVAATTYQWDFHCVETQ